MAAFLAVLVVLIPFATVSYSRADAKTDELIAGFRQPSASARPWVYWFIMDGNFSREGITADLEAMERVGIGGAILMEVDVGIPRGPVKFMSEEWRALFRHAVQEAERLGLEITLNAGPGWTGSGGPWVKPERSMQHLVASAVEVAGPTEFNAVLPHPQPRKPYFGEKGLPVELLKAMQAFLPAYTGRIVDSLEITERFLWDLRQTAQELVVENHALHLKELARRHGFGLSIEVANLWPNRLIGDQVLPLQQRVAWTTRNPFKKDSPLLPSGLIGPVVIH